MSADVYGISVGPGAPDLLTLRARALLENVDELYCPRASVYGESLAYRIVQSFLAHRHTPPHFLHFPMTKNAEVVRQAVQQAVNAIASAVAKGRSVGFLTEGDCSTYSSFIYVRRLLARDHPQIKVEAVPGVSSIMAVPAVSGLELADGHERVAILPATYGVHDLAAILAAFDTVVLMKVGTEWPEIARAVEQAGLLQHAVFVNKATMPEQRIVTDLRQLAHHRGDCQSMIVIRKPGRAGLLVGESVGEPSFDACAMRAVP